MTGTVLPMTTDGTSRGGVLSDSILDTVVMKSWAPALKWSDGTAVKTSALSAQYSRFGKFYIISARFTLSNTDTIPSDKYLRIYNLPDDINIGYGLSSAGIFSSKTTETTVNDSMVVIQPNTSYLGIMYELDAGYISNKLTKGHEYAFTAYCIAA